MQFSRAFFTACAFLLLACPLHAQIPVAVFGRVEDASSRQPVVGATVFSPDSSSVAVTDSLGEFAIQIDPGEQFAVRVQTFGYVSERFELGEDAASRINILLLEPAPIQLSGVNNVVREDAVTELLDDLKDRRNFYQGAVSVFDRAGLERFAAVGSAWDFIRMRAWQVFQCTEGLSGLCVRGRGGGSVNDPYPTSPVSVCVDGWSSWGAVSELSNLDIHSVALLEIYGGGRGGIRVYTPGYLAHAARTGEHIARPLRYGC